MHGTFPFLLLPTGCIPQVSVGEKLLCTLSSDFFSNDCRKSSGKKKASGKVKRFSCSFSSNRVLEAFFAAGVLPPVSVGEMTKVSPRKKFDLWLYSSAHVQLDSLEILPSQRKKMVWSCFTYVTKKGIWCTIFPVWDNNG